MKVNELMIGDWVLFGSKPLLIHTLRECGIIEFMDPENHNMIFTSCSYVEDITSPVPLTTDILEKNGFGKEDILGNKSSIPYLLQVFDEDGITMYQKLFKFVHELQHALRLCGLNELANNFKVSNY